MTMEDNEMIRQLNKNENEINTIMRIWKDATIKAHAFIPETYWNDSYTVVKEQYIPIAETYVYVDNDVIKGFVSIIDRSFIGAIFVDTNYQGEGVGSKLINHVLDRYDNLELAVYKDNDKSVYFYKKNGFEALREEINDETHKIEIIMRYKGKS